MVLTSSPPNSGRSARTHSKKSVASAAGILIAVGLGQGRVAGHVGEYERACRLVGHRFAQAVPRSTLGMRGLACQHRLALAVLLD